MIPPLPELAQAFEPSADTLSPEEQAQHIAAIEAHIAQQGLGGQMAPTPFPEAGEAQATPVESSDTPAKPEVAIPEPKIPKTIRIEARSLFSPPGVVFLGVGKESAQKAYKAWLTRAFSEALAQTGTEKPGQGATYQRAMRLLHTLIMIAKGQQQHETFQLIYEGRAFPRQLKIEPVILDLVKTNKPILLSLAPYFGLGSSHVTTEASPVPEDTVEKLPEPEILDADPQRLFV